MREFFNYQSPYRTDIFLDLNVFERVLPIIGIALVIYYIYKYRDVLRNKRHIDTNIRITLGVSLFVLYASHFILRFALYGLDTIVLPFHLCSVAMAFAIYLLFTNNKVIYSFVLMTGVLGSIVSLSYPIIGYDSSYYRYYQFFFAHGILLVTPLYYLIVYRWVPSKKEVFKAYIILQILAKFMLVFNYFMGTDFMFMFLDPSKLDKFPIIKYLGGIPYYLIVAELVIGLYFYGSYKLFSYLKKEKESRISYKGGEYESN